MIVPAVKPGDIVDVIAPASPFAPAELKTALAALRAQGLVPRVPKTILKPDGLFASSDRHRLKHLRDALYAEDSSLIWCVRGGYGSMRLLDDMAKWRAPKRAKIFLGYSDLTSLHVFLNQRWGWPTLHGPMLGRFGRTVPPGERRQQLDVLFGRAGDVTFSKLKALNAAARAKRSVSGPILGGNAAVLQSGLGTPGGLDPRGALVFFEDIGERPHRVDRMLTQFRQAGWFKRARAVVFGDFNLTLAADRRQLWREVIPRFAAMVDIPVVAGVPCGHCVGKQLTLPLNTKAKLQLGRVPSLNVSTGLTVGV